MNSRTLRSFVAGLSATLLIFPAVAQKEIPLYTSPIPKAKNVPDEETNKNQVVRNVSKPTLTAFFPPEGTANGASVIICPGGGYGVLVIDREGYQVAKAFNKIGVTAFVLKYRLPSTRTMEDPSIGPLQDAQQAIKVVRQRAVEWGVDPNKIGIMGFSAGGHLAATAETHFDSAFIANSEKTSLRPDFAVLVYPVISLLDKVGHVGSGKNLLGEVPSQSKVRYFSNELQVTKTTPPTFLTHATDDTVVPVENSLLFYEALHRNKVPTDMHIYARGEHGYLKEPSFEEWFGRCTQWMKQSGFIP